MLESKPSRGEHADLRGSHEINDDEMETLNVGKVLRRSQDYAHCARLFHFATDYCIRTRCSKLTGAHPRTPCSDLAACERANHSLRNLHSTQLLAARACPPHSGFALRGQRWKLGWCRQGRRRDSHWS